MSTNNNPQRKLHAALLNYINSNNGNSRTNARTRLVNAINNVWGRGGNPVSQAASIAHTSAQTNLRAIGNNGGGNSGSVRGGNSGSVRGGNNGGGNSGSVRGGNNGGGNSVHVNPTVVEMANTNLELLKKHITSLTRINNLGGAYKNNPTAFKNWIKNKQFSSPLNARFAYLKNSKVNTGGSLNFQTPLVQQI
jgi:hypothetical protein